MFFRSDSKKEDEDLSMDELLELSQNKDKDKRRKAVVQMGGMDKQFEPVVERLEHLKENDPDASVRTEAATALNKLSSKPLSEEYAKKEAGAAGTAFDDEVGDSSLKAGEYDVESSMEDSEEDRIEAEAEGKGLFVVLNERNKVTMNYNGEKVSQEASSGKVMVQNTGSRNRITGVDLVLSNVSDVETEEDIEDHTYIGVLSPGKEAAWKFDYNFDKEIEPIQITQVYEDPDTGVSPNFLGGQEREFEARISITNSSDETIYNVKGVKTLNTRADLLESSLDGGEISKEENKVKFTIDEIAAGANKEVLLKLKASLPEDVEAYESGELVVTYDNKDNLISGLGFESIDGVSDFKQRVRRRQRETEPAFYDCEIILENKSEFVYDLNRFSVFAGDVESQQVVLDWEGEEASEDEREIVPSEKVAFEFVFESPETAPTFGEHIEFSVQYETKITSTTEVLLPAENLKFMAISITKVFLDEEGGELSEYELPSYVETPVPTLVTLTGIGTFPLEGLVIRDEIPEGFRVPEINEVSVKRGEQELDTNYYDVNVGAGESGLDELTVNVNHLEDTEDGGLGEGDQIFVQYTAIADRPEPRDEDIKVQSHGEGYLYENETNRVYADSEIEGLKLVVVHRRDDVDIGKYIMAIAHEGRDAYQIELEAENYGTSTLQVEIKDLIPHGFELIAGSIEAPENAVYTDLSDAKDGQVHGWTIDNVEPENRITVTYKVAEIEDDANPRKLQTVYKG